MTHSTYLLPIRRKILSAVETEELREYLSILAQVGCEVIVVDGSAPEIFAQHHGAWSDQCHHAPVDPRFKYLNDKVNGVHTGVALATNEKIILADDDIRYNKIDIEKICALLDQLDVIRPQNYLVGTPRCGVRTSQRDVPTIFWLPLCAKMEAARMFINRATLRSADYPGTCAFRRAMFLKAGEYDGDVLFDNEELIRHFVRRGARIFYANDLFISKCPPTFGKWLEQRPRQAYEDFGLRFKTLLFASLFPIAIAIAFIDPRWLSIVLLSILVAFAGWMRGRARKYFPFHVCFFAPLWVVERTLSTYLAFYWWIVRGGYPFGDRVLKKGIGRDWIEGGKVPSAASRE